MQAPYNNFIIKVASKFQDEIVFKSGFKLYLKTRQEEYENVALVAKVVSIPKECDRYHDIVPGDHVLIRYDVIFDYKNTERNKPVEYKNMIYYNFQEQWLCRPEQIYAVLRNDMEYMLGDYIKLEPADSPALQTSLILPEYLKKKPSNTSAVIANIGANELGLSIGDTVYFKRGISQKYLFGDYRFSIIKHQHVLGVHKN